MLANELTISDSNGAYSVDAGRSLEVESLLPSLPVPYQFEPIARQAAAGYFNLLAATGCRC